MKVKLAVVAVFMMAMSYVAPGMTADSVGKVLYVKGVATAHQDNADGAAQGTRFLGVDQALFEGDVLTTSKAGFAIIQMADQGKITLRPNTVFKVETYRYQADGAADQNKGVLKLFRGGVRAVTGLINKRNPESGLQLQSPVATLGIRGTEFDTRLCRNDCARENSKLKPVKQVRPRVVGRIAFARGKVNVYGAGGAVRGGVTGTALFRRDEVETLVGASAVLVFRDNTRITVRPNTRMKVDRFRFRDTQVKRNNSVFSLLRGGLRVVTGLVARRDRQQFRLNTPVAVVGVRGTNFDVRCEGQCANAQPQAAFPDDGLELIRKALAFILQPAFAQPSFNFNTNLAVYTRQGETSLQLPDQPPFVIPQGRVGSVAIGELLPRLLPGVPLAFLNDATVRPETVAPQVQQRFGQQRVDTDRPGQYTVVFKGDVEVRRPGQPPLNLGRGESGFTGQLDDKPVRLPRIPKFIFQDDTPVPDQLDTDSGAVLEDSSLQNKLIRDDRNECN